MFYYKQQRGNQRYVPLRRTEVSRGAHDYHHAPQRQLQLVRELAQQIIRARRVVVLTGAGVSTGSGLRDQSSGMSCSNSIKSGPGINAVRSELANISSMNSGVGKNNKRIALASRLAQAQEHAGSPSETVPSLAHMSLVTLAQENHIHHVISTNTDGLHWRSGISPAMLTTLQGNPYAEACGDCGHQYLRDFLVRGKKNMPRTFKRPRGSHETGRYCTHPECQGLRSGGRLYDNMVLPNEAIDSHTMRRALNEIHQCDLLLVLGSSLREEPALVCVNRALKAGKKRNEAFKHVVMVSLQQTMHDDAVDTRIFSDVNVLLKQLCNELDCQQVIPYRIRLRIRIGIIYAKNENANMDNLIRMGIVVPGAELPPHPNGELFVSVEEQNGLPLTCISSLNVRLPEEYAYYGSRRMSKCVDYKSSQGEDWDGRVRCNIDPMAHEGWAQVCVTLRSAGPVVTSMTNKPLYFSYWLGTENEGESSTAYILEYNPLNGTWCDEPISIEEDGDNGYQQHIRDRDDDDSRFNTRDGGSRVGPNGPNVEYNIHKSGKNRNSFGGGGGGGRSSRNGSALGGGRSSIWSREKPTDFNMEDGGLGGGVSGGSSLGTHRNGKTRTSSTGGTSLSSSRIDTGDSSRVGTSGSGGLMVTFSALPATRVATAELGSGTMDGMFPSPSRVGTAESNLGNRLPLPKTPIIGIRRNSNRSNRSSNNNNSDSNGNQEGLLQEGLLRRASSPVMEDLLDRATSSPNVEDLVHRLSRPSMISGSDMPLKRLTMSGGEKFNRPVSENRSARNQKARLDDLMHGKKISKERKHSVVDGKGRELMKPQGFRNVATAVPMSPIGKKRDRKGLEEDDKERLLKSETSGTNNNNQEKKRTVTPQVNYCGYSTQ